MQTVIDDFDDRVKEIKNYFNFLELLDKDVPKLTYSEKGLGMEFKIDTSLSRILKANGFILLYNLVEATCRNSLWTILEQIKKDNLGITDIREELKLIWLTHQFKNWRNSNDDNLIKKINSIVDYIVNGSILDFQKEHLDLSGNVDARKIRILANDFGFSSDVTNPQTGNDLHEIKKNRNYLAHGNKTFIECGKDYSVNQMLAFKDNVIIYLTDILQNISIYIQNKDYKKNLIP